MMLTDKKTLEIAAKRQAIRAAIVSTLKSTPDLPQELAALLIADAEATKELKGVM